MGASRVPVGYNLVAISDRGGEVMVELLEKIDVHRGRAVELRARLGKPTEDEVRESRVRSVYASLAIEDPTVTIEEVREALRPASRA